MLARPQALMPAVCRAVCCVVGVSVGAMRTVSQCPCPRELDGWDKKAVGRFKVRVVLGVRSFHPVFPLLENDFLAGCPQRFTPQVNTSIAAVSVRSRSWSTLSWLTPRD